jgi:RNA polymerase primary sigma factor
MGSHQVIVDKLYDLYQSRGFVREEEALDLMEVHDLSLPEIERVTGTLIGMGVIFAEDSPTEDEDDEDRTRTDYESIFSEILSISPGQRTFIDFIRDIRAPQWREWINLMPQAKAGNSYATNRLFEMYLRVVVRLALNFYKNEGYELDDLIQEGAIGLLSAISHYNDSKHESFVSYFPTWVMQFMIRAIMNKKSTIRLPVHVQESLRKLVSSIAEIKQGLNCEPSPPELALKTGMTLEKFQEMQTYLEEPISIETFEQEDGDGFIWYGIVDIDSQSPIEMVYESLRKNCIESELKALSDRESSILSMRFGLDDGQERTLEEIGCFYNVTRERIRQIETRALHKLQYSAHTKRLKSYLTV